MTRRYVGRYTSLKTTHSIKHKTSDIEIERKCEEKGETLSGGVNRSEYIRMLATSEVSDLERSPDQKKATAGFEPLHQQAEVISHSGEAEWGKHYGR